MTKIASFVILYTNFGLNFVFFAQLPVRTYKFIELLNFGRRGLKPILAQYLPNLGKFVPCMGCGSVIQ